MADFSLQFQATVTIADQIPESEQFSFILKKINDSTEEEIEIKKNDENGNITFSPVIFNDTGVYYYTISEILGNDETINYDNSVINITVTVEEDLISSNYTNSYEFKNTFVEEVSPSSIIGTEASFAIIVDGVSHSFGTSADKVKINWTQLTDDEQTVQYECSLKDFFENWMHFKENGTFVYYGELDPTPVHSIKVWYDTTKDNSNEVQEP